MSGMRRGQRPPAPTTTNAEHRLTAIQRLTCRPSPTGAIHIGEAIQRAIASNA
jgi:glutamyl/glutaminyl-tRNA synthetase